MVPPRVTTLISTTPAPAEGDTAVIWVELLMIKEVATLPPKFTAVAVVRLVPVITTEVPPDVGPEFGEMEVIVGAR